MLAAEWMSVRAITVTPSPVEHTSRMPEVIPWPELPCNKRVEGAGYPAAALRRLMPEMRREAWCQGQ